MDLSASSSLRLAKDLKTAESQGRFSVGGIKLGEGGFKARMESGAKPGFTVEGKLVMIPDPRLAELIRPAAALKRIRLVEPTLDFSVRADGALATLLDASAQRSLGADATLELKGYGQWLLKSQVQLKKSADATSSSGSTVISQVSAPDGLSVSLPEPIKITHRLNMDARNTDGEITAEMPLLEIQKVGRIQATRFSATARTPKATMGQDLDLAMELKQGDIVLDESFAKNAPKLAGLDMSAKARLRGGNQLELESFAASFGQSLLRLTADATGKLKTRDFETRGTLSIHVPDDFPKMGGQRLRGQIDVPWTLSVVGGRELDLDGAVNIKNLAASSAQGGVSDVSGAIPLSERLVWDGKRVHFAHLITQNPFERVDFERVRPLLEGADQVRVGEIRWEEKTYGPMVGYFSVHQNMIQAQKVDVSLGSGKIYGEMFLDAYPANLQCGMLSRITGLNLAEIIPQKYLVKIPSGDKAISARTGIVMDLNKRTVDGRIDITEIGAAPLMMMINVMDPQYQDDKMNRMRSALSLGSPSFVGISMQKGYMDMDARIVSAVGVPVPTPGIHSFPLSSWIDAFTADIVKKTQEGPLK